MWGKEDTAPADCGWKRDRGKKKNLNEKRDDVGELCKGSHKILTSFKLALQKYSKVNEYPWIAVFGDSNGENLGGCSSTLVKNPHHPDHSLG